MFNKSRIYNFVFGSAQGANLLYNNKRGQHLAQFAGGGKGGKDRRRGEERRGGEGRRRGKEGGKRGS